MKYLKKIRIYIASFFLKIKLKKYKRNIKTCNLQNAKQIALIYNSNIPGNKKILSSLENIYKEKGILVHVLGYSANPNMEEILISDRTHLYLTHKDFNWLYHPKNPSVIDFINKEYDILINLYTQDEFTIEYLVRLSKACFKVGSAHLKTTMHDLMIDTGEHKHEINYLSSQINHYLSTINI
jgi:hypothetical protein